MYIGDICKICRYIGDIYICRNMQIYRRYIYVDIQEIYICRNMWNNLETKLFCESPGDPQSFKLLSPPFPVIQFKAKQLPDKRRNHYQIDNLTGHLRNFSRIFQIQKLLQLEIFLKILLRNNDKFFYKRKLWFVLHRIFMPLNKNRL